MKLTKKLLPLLFLPLLLIPAYAQESTGEIPVWVKGVANFWAEGNISDGEFGEAITFLIEQEIIQIDSVEMSQVSNVDPFGLSENYQAVSNEQQIQNYETLIADLKQKQKDDIDRIQEENAQDSNNAREGMIDRHHTELAKQDERYDELVLKLEKVRYEYNRAYNFCEECKEQMMSPQDLGID